MNQFIFAAIALPTLGLLSLALRVVLLERKNKKHKRLWLARAKATTNPMEKAFCWGVATRGAL